jgi:hypothetical protein
VLNFISDAISHTASIHYASGIYFPLFSSSFLLFFPRLHTAWSEQNKKRAEEGRKTQKRVERERAEESRTEESTTEESRI